MPIRYEVKENVLGCEPSNKQVRDKILFVKGQILELVGYGITVSPSEYTIKYKILGTEQIVEVITTTFFGKTPFLLSLKEIRPYHE